MWCYPKLFYGALSNSGYFMNSELKNLGERP